MDRWSLCAPKWPVLHSKAESRPSRRGLCDLSSRREYLPDLGFVTPSNPLLSIPTLSFSPHATATHPVTAMRPSVKTRACDFKTDSAYLTNGSALRPSTMQRPDPAPMLPHPAVCFVSDRVRGPARAGSRSVGRVAHRNSPHNLTGREGRSRPAHHPWPGRGHDLATS